MSAYLRQLGYYGRVSMADGARARAPVSASMTGGAARAIRVAAHGVASLATAAIIGSALAQVPVPVEEQVRLFRSMAPAQQQALIRELQRTLPPAQREAIIRLLEGDGNVERAADGEALEAAPAESPEAERVPTSSAPEGALKQD